LGLDCLVEVHTSEELTKSLATGTNMIRINNCNLTALQFHGNESVDYCQQFKRQVIKAIKVVGDGRLFPDPARYEGVIRVFF